jgi:hypothetical protein
MWTALAKYLPSSQRVDGLRTQRGTGKEGQQGDEMPVNERPGKADRHRQTIPESEAADAGCRELPAVPAQSRRPAAVPVIAKGL